MSPTKESLLEKPKTKIAEQDTVVIKQIKEIAKDLLSEHFEESVKPEFEVVEKRFDKIDTELDKLKTFRTDTTVKLDAILEAVMANKS